MLAIRKNGQYLIQVLATRVISIYLLKTVHYVMQVFL